MPERERRPSLSVFCNSYKVTTSVNGTVRLDFGEGRGSPESVFYHSAVTMQRADAQALLKTLDHMLTSTEWQHPGASPAATERKPTNGN